ncbi:MAG TPA: DUF2207 domain-containing protein [Terriglobales bacterium]|nr:DUF2207 domain-containing protein [Terriglobales bacterium]
MLNAKCQIRLLAIILLLAAPAFAREWHITNFDSSMTVAQDGTMSVREHLAVSFEGRYHGIYRDIPIQYPGRYGSNYTLFLTVTGVTDGFGHKLKYDSSVQGDYRHLKIYIPGAEDTTKIVEIDYTVKNAVRWFDDHDELYWNVTGNDWPVPIDSAMAIILFPPGAVNNLRAQAFTGIYGSQAQDATVNVNGNVVRVTSNPLSMREGLTADVYITKGVLTEPSKLTFAVWCLRSNVIVLLPLWALVVMFFFWWTKGRDPKPDISVAPMYEPPQGMTPAEVGSLMDDSVHPRDITSTLVDLAVKGYIKIEETESKLLVFSHRDYTFHLLKPEPEWANLAAHERLMLRHMFSGGRTEVQLSELRNQFYVAIPTLKEDILAELRSKGMYTVDPDSAHAYVLAGVVFTALPFVVAQVLGWADVLSSVWLLIAAGLIALIIVFLFARIMTAKSLKGVRTKVQILGFQEFINRVDADRLKRMPPDTFEKFLPYAMALGLEHRWAKAFQGIVHDPPTWYVGPTPYAVFDPLFFATSMHAMAMDAHQAFVAAPRASSTGSGWGGGFGGGGFSGGGFGGGGGGAF